jgi:hypothetical protein
MLPRAIHLCSQLWIRIILSMNLVGAFVHAFKSNLLTEKPPDTQSLVEGVKFARKVAQTEPFKDKIGTILCFFCGNSLIYFL